jgi:hypothetical protein
MTLAFSKKLQISSGDKKMHIYEVTHDAGTIAISASSLEMNYIDYAICVPVTIPDSITGDAYPMLSIAGPSIAISFSDALSDGAIVAVQAWGW